MSLDKLYESTVDLIPGFVYDSSKGEVVGDFVNQEGKYHFISQNTESYARENLALADNEITGTSDRAAITALLVDGEELSLRELAQKTGIIPSEVKGHLTDMEDKNIVQRGINGYRMPEELSNQMNKLAETDAFQN